MNAIPKFNATSREEYYHYFKRHSAKLSPNTEWLCRMLASWRTGLGALPDALGLAQADFTALHSEFFRKLEIPASAPSGRTADFSRMLEKDDLIRYLQTRAAYPERAETAWITHILVAGCLGDDHLWQDLGLWSRQDLSGLIAYNFPQVAAANNQDMKWKKFLYKQLCEAEGIYVCRAPSCDVCVDYPRCFGAED
ncbi:MAG: nitrogen fixation protein NifQ [Candidatus Methylumidiphilus sp.]